PAVEPAAVAPDTFDHPADPPIPPGQQPLDQGRFPIVIAHAHVAADPAVAVDLRAEFAKPAVDDVGMFLSSPLEGGVRLGNEGADGDRAPDVLAPAGFPAGSDHPMRHVGDLQYVVVGLCG